MPYGKRIHFLDAARGMIIVLMILYHALYDMAWLFDVRWAQTLYMHPLMHAAQVTGASVFIIITGISSHLSRSNVARGLKILLAALIITAASFIIMPESPIYFGILHFIGVSVIIYGLIKRFLPDWFYSPLWLAAFFACFFLLYGRRFDVPHLYIFGFPDYNFMTADYFPLLPWIFMYFFGLWCGRCVVGGKLPNWFYELELPPLEFVGRNPLIIYVLHQPAVYAILWLVLELLKLLK